MSEMQIRTLTFVDIFDEECFGHLEELLHKAIVKSCKRHGLDPADWESWAIGFTHLEVPETVPHYYKEGDE